MKDIGERFKRELGVKLPDDYRQFLEDHCDKLSDDPFDERNWTPGLAGVNFVIGTTQAFRDRFPHLPRESIIIGYVGQKEIEKIHEYEDVFMMLDTRTGEVFEVDSFDATRKIADSIGELIVSLSGQEGKG